MPERASIRQALIELLEEETGEKYPHLEESQRLREDLGLDSVDVVSIISQVERRFHLRLSHEELQTLTTVGDVLDLLQHKLQQPAAVPSPSPAPQASVSQSTRAA
jgi:acyl carrier protein